MISIDDFSPLASSVYGAAADPQKWPTVIDQIARAAGAPWCSLLRTGPAGSGVVFPSPGFVPANMRAYDEYYAALDPVPAALAARPVGSVVDSEDVGDPQVWKNSEFFNEWVPPRRIHQQHVRRRAPEPRRHSVVGNAPARPEP